MADNSLKSMLQTLANAPESEKKAVVRSLLAALSEACGLFKSSAACADVARKVQRALGEVLLPMESEEPSGPSEELEETLADQDWEEEELVESGSFAEADKTFISTNAPAVPTEESEAESSEKQAESPEKQLESKIQEWNDNSKTWLQLPAVKPQNPDSVVGLVLAMAGVRTNIASNQFEEQEETLQKFDEHFEQTLPTLKELSYQVHPTSLGQAPQDLSEFQGQTIYTCRPRSTEQEISLVAPGITHNGRTLREAVWSVSLPLESEFPAYHPNASLPSHWRGLFGEIELLLHQIEMQPRAYCAIEGVNKNKIEILDKCRAMVISETKRRSEVLQTTIQKESESVYRLATDYWRIEECFWSLFHDDSRPAGCSYFDRMRSRIQSWRTTLRKVLKFHIRDFACGNDSLASVNQYIGNIILQPRKNVSPGTVVRELRPAIVIKDQATSRLLKGRVIAT